MSLLTSLASPSTGAHPAPRDLARPIGEDRPAAPVPPVARGQAPRPAMDDRPRRLEPREAERRQGHAKAAPDRTAHRPRTSDSGPEDLAPASGPPGTSDLAVFLVQMFGQDRDRAAHGLSGHRDAASLGSDAYRRAGGAPPAFSEAPAVFRIVA